MKKLFRILLTVFMVILALAVAAVSVAAAAYFHRSDPAAVKHYQTTNPHITGETQISAHRAGGGISPEETLMAFRYCAESAAFSVDVFELDLHITKDGVLVLLHDDVLDGTSDCEEIFGETDVRPEEKTFQELSKLNMGAKFTADDGSTPYADLHRDAVPDDLRILSLDAMFDYTESVGDFHYIIEIKNGGELGKKGVDILYQTVSRRGLLDRVVFGSFHAEVSAYKDEAYPDLMRGAYSGEVLDFYLAAVSNKADYEPPCAVLQIPFGDIRESYGINLGTATVVNYAHAHNMAVQYWTINRERDMRYLISIGADCIMTDYPDILSRVLS